MRSDRSGGIRRMANRNYGGNGSRALIVAAQAAVTSQMHSDRSGSVHHLVAIMAAIAAAY
jgi:hypothetical protein